MINLQTVTAYATSILAALSFTSKAAEIPTRFEKGTNTYEPLEIGLNGLPVVHTVDFTSYPAEGRTGGSYISNGKPSTSGLMIQSDTPIAILSAKQKVEIDFFGDAESPNDFINYNYYVSSDKEGLINQSCPKVTILGKDLQWEPTNEYFTINFDFTINPIISDSSDNKVYCVPAATVAHNSNIVPRNVYIKDGAEPNIKGFVWAENAQGRFEWLSERSLRDNPTAPALTYPSQAVSYIKLKKIEAPKWSDNAQKVGIKLEADGLTLIFSDEPFKRRIEASTDLKEWTEVYTLPAHEINIVTTPYANMKFFRIGELSGN